MKYKITKEAGDALIDFTIPKENWDAAIEAVYKKNASRFKIDGFRKGAAPRRIIERFYGADIFFDDAFDYIARESYVEVLSKEKNIHPVSAPKVEKLNMAPAGGAAIEFSMRITLKPELTLGEYRGIKIEQVEYTVKQDDIDKELKQAQERASRLIDVTNRAIKDGDTVTLDYSGFVGKEQFKGGTAENQQLVIGSGQFIPGFEEQLIGIKIGGKKDVKVTFPTEYHAPDLAGKEAVFKTQIHAIQEKELPALDDNFAKDTSKFDTLEEYKKDIKSRLQEGCDRKNKNEFRVALLDAVAKCAKVTIPNCMIEDELEEMLNEFAQRIGYMYQGIKIEDYFKITQSSPEDYKNQNRGEAEKTIKTRLGLQEIIKKEKLEVSKSAIDSHIKDLAKKANKVTEKEVEAFKATFDDNALNQIKSQLTLDKLFEFLTKHNTIVKVKEKKTNSEDKSAAKKVVTSKATTSDKNVADKTAAKKKTTTK